MTVPSSAPAALATLSASVITSGPMPSPGITATRGADGRLAIRLRSNRALLLTDFQVTFLAIA